MALRSLLPTKGGTFVFAVTPGGGSQHPLSQISRLRLAKVMFLESVSQVGMGSPSGDKSQLYSTVVWAGM